MAKRSGLVGQLMVSDTDPAAARAAAGVASKDSQADANYREADGEESCESCAHFSPKRNTCRVVSGKIEPGYVSDSYEPIA